MRQRIAILLISVALQLRSQNSGLDRAWKLVAAGQRAEAVPLLREVVKSEPDNADARLLLGTLLSAERHHEEAIAQLTVAVQLRPKSSEATNALGEAELSFGDYAAARRAFESAISLDGRNGVAELNLGHALLESELFAEAAPPLDRAIEILKPGADAANAHYLRAKVHTEFKELRQAAVDLQKAVALQPVFPEAWSDLGQTRQNLGDHSGALAAFRRAVELAPNDSVAQYRLGEEYLGEHQAHLAVKPLEEADRLDPGDQSTLNALQKALRQDGQTGEAEKAKQRLADVLAQREISSENELTAVKINNEGARLQSAGDLAGALEKYRAAVKLSPESVPIRVNYAVALLRLGQWTDGLNELHHCVLSDPTNAKIRAALRDALAQAPAGAVPHWSDSEN